MPWPFQQPFYAARPAEPMPTLEAIAVADERLDPSEEDEEGEGEEDGEDPGDDVQVAQARRSAAPDGATGR